MKKIYVTPAMQAEEMELTSIIANSPNFDGKEDGTGGLDGFGGSGGNSDGGLEADGKERDPWTDGLW